MGSSSGAYELNHESARMISDYCTEKTILSMRHMLSQKYFGVLLYIYIHLYFIYPASKPFIKAMRMSRL